MHEIYSPYLLYSDFTAGAPEDRVGDDRKVCLLSRLSDFKMISLQITTKYNLFECHWGLVLSHVQGELGELGEQGERLSAMRMQQIETLVAKQNGVMNTGITSIYVYTNIYI